MHKKQNNFRPKYYGCPEFNIILRNTFIYSQRIRTREKVTRTEKKRKLEITFSSLTENENPENPSVAADSQALHSSSLLHHPYLPE